LSVTLDAPGTIAADPGKDRTLGRLLLTKTTIPLDGAGPLSRTVTRPRPPPLMTVWTDRSLRTGSLTRTTLDTDLPPNEAVTVTFVSAYVGTVRTVIDALSEPAGTVMDAGTGMSGLFDVRLTFAPPEGAGSDS
jgi:hypothetical protein